MFQDPVKYPDNMSPNFKSFLKGLLNKVSMWLPSLLLIDSFNFPLYATKIFTWPVYKWLIGPTKSIGMACSS